MSDEGETSSGADEAEDGNDDGDEFDFYPCVVDRAPASIFVNLRYEREDRSAADTRYDVTVQMLDAGPLGIGTADEADAFFILEEALIESCRDAGVLYVGRLRHGGAWDVTFYGPSGHVEALHAVATEHAGSRRVDVRGTHDPAWSHYFEFLLPDAERRQWMEDRRLVQVLQEYGDTLITPRRVDHWAYFDSEQSRDAFVAAASRATFALEEASHDSSLERPYGAHVSRTDPIELDHIHEVVMILVDAAAEHGGHYDGWETSIERG